jgi:hypothetical protein
VPGQRNGAVRITHDGEPGALAVSGLLVGRSFRATLPLAAPADPTRTSEFHAVRLPLAVAEAGGRPARTVLVLNNLSTGDQQIEIAVLDQATGAELRRFERRLRGSAWIRSISRPTPPQPHRFACESAAREA